jgi:hypothetical protein
MSSFRHKKENCWNFGFLSFLLKKKYEKKLFDNMSSLMLNPRFKTFHLVNSLINHEQRKAIVEKYDRIFLFPMLF